MSASKLSRHLLITMVIIGCLGSLASAGTIRHDRPDSWYLERGADYPSVGQIVGTKVYDLTPDPPFEFAASGTLIAPNWVLTSAHAIADNPDGISSPRGPFEVTSLKFILGGIEYPVSARIPYAGFDWQFLSGTDIGLLQFETDLAEAAGVEPARRYVGRGELGRVGTSVGYGATGTGLTGADVSVGIDDLEKRAGHNMIDGWVGPEAGNFRILMSDFDNPDNDESNSTGDNVIGSPYPLEYEYLIAPGDSGGGLFIENRQGEDLLAGVHSFTAASDGALDSDYGDLSAHTRVSVFNGWINSVLKGDLGKGGAMRPDRPFESQTAGWGELNVAVVPEPSTLCLLCIGGLCLLGGCWRKRKR